MPTRAEWNEMYATIEDLLPRAARLYLGRSNFPERRLLEHVRDADRYNLYAMAWSSSTEAVAATEEVLIDEYSDLYRLENGSPQSAGRWGTPPYAIYVSWTWKAGVGDRTVNGLSAVEVARLPTVPHRSRHLHTNLSPDQAAQLLAARRRAA